ncbi:MAG: hypothetical protein H0U74_07230 [Bradymonadaceae bacterium]|nr:hypothetical protein [Lujinxingiaceae bacterium]
MTIEIQNVVFLNMEGILLVEFAIELAKWLRQVREGRFRNFYYASMDFEIEPIFALFFNDSWDGFVPASVWSDKQPSVISPDTAICAAEKYIRELAVHLNPLCQDSCRLY